MKNFKLLLSAVILSITLNSCSSDSNEVETEIPSGEIVNNGGVFTTQIFKTNNTIEKIKYSSNYYDLFTYNENKLVLKESFDNNNNLLSSIELFYSLSGELNYYILNSSSNANLIKYDFVYNSSTEIEIQSSQLDRDTMSLISNGITSSINLDINSNILSPGFTFDNKNNIFTNATSIKELILIYRGGIISNNNIISDTSLSSNKYIVNTYNNNDFIVSKAVYDNNDTSDTSDDFISSETTFNY